MPAERLSKSAGTTPVDHSAPAARRQEDRPRKSAHRDTLSAALGRIVAAVAAARDVDGILATVVDEAKTVTGADKVVLCLVDAQNGAPAMHYEGLAVRGSRRQHPERWWRSRLEDVVEEMFEDPGPRLVPGERASLLCVPVSVGERPVGLLAAISDAETGFKDRDAGLLTILASLAALAIDRDRLAESSRHALLAEERRRISQEMHDGLAQSLFSVSLGLEVCKQQIAAGVYETVGEDLHGVQDTVRESLTELRRYIYDLRPASLERLGFTESLRRRLGEATAGSCEGTLAVRGRARPLGQHVEECLYRVGQESLANASKHSSAKRIEVLLVYRTTSVELVVKDDGRGFELGPALEASERGRSLGLRSMRERVEREGGTLAICSSQEGTTVRARLKS